MKLRIVILDNRLQAFIEEGAYEQAVPALNKLLANLRASGITLEATSLIEQHKHDIQEVKLDVS